MPATLIIPGYKGSEAGHWQRQWLHDDPSALLVEQDDWHYPVLSDWMHALEAKLAENPGAVLVAHSRCTCRRGNYGPQGQPFPELCPAAAP